MATKTKVQSSTTAVAKGLGEYIKACAAAKTELPTPTTREQAEWLMGQFLSKQDVASQLAAQMATLKTDWGIQMKHASLFRTQLEQWFKASGEEIPVELGEGVISLGNKSSSIDKFDEDKLRAYAEKNGLDIFGTPVPDPISHNAIKDLLDLVTKGRDKGRFRFGGKLVPGVRQVAKQKIKIERAS